MMHLLAMPPGDMSNCAAILLVVGPGLNGEFGDLVGVEVEAAILLVIGPGLTGTWVTKELQVVAGSWATKEVDVLDAQVFLDFFEVFLDLLDFEVSPFLFLPNRNLSKPLCSLT